MRRVTPDIPIYRGRTRNGTIETERPTRTVCRLITQSSRATKIEQSLLKQNAHYLVGVFVCAPDG